MSLCNAETDLDSGADNSLGSKLDMTSDMTAPSFVMRVRTRSFPTGSRRMPRSKAELSDLCTAAHDWLANLVIFCKPRKASTVFARFSIQTALNDWPNFLSSFR